MRTIVFLMMILFLLSCNRPKSYEKEIKATLLEEVNLGMIKNINDKNLSISYNDFRSKFEYVYIVYLQNDCSPCYSTYISWQEEIAKLEKFDNFTVLFIIKGNSYDEFKNNASKFGLKEDRFYTFMDRDDIFRDSNINIPLSIMKNSFLINKKNQIVLIGSPFSTPEMKKVFKDICFKEGTP